MLVAPIATNFYRGKHKVPSFVLGLPPKIKLIKDKVERWGVACSEDDESVPQPENAEWYAENLDARLAEFKNERHFADDQPTERCPDGTRTLPPRALNLLSWVIDL
jgi:predicted alpha/beta hydrolase family esterase